MTTALEEVGCTEGLEVERPQSERTSEPSQRASRSSKSKKQPRYHVILWNDDDHTYEYVIEMLGRLFGHDRVRGFELAKEVDTQGRCICMTTTMELAELKRDQIHAFGADPRMKQCRGSMRASIQPAPE